jgi:hypothetical protein
MYLCLLTLFRSFGFLSMVLLVGVVAAYDRCRHAFPLWMSHVHVRDESEIFTPSH